jgi:arabinose-5-phosphate isomerase
VTLLAVRKFSELPVVDRTGRPVGLIDVTDVLGLKDESATKNEKPQPDVRIFPTEGAA